jgi:hypothetical protein
MNAYDVPALAVTELWPLAEPLLRDALKWHPYVSEAGLLELLVNDRAQLVLFTAEDRVQVALVMEVTQYPEHRVGNAIFLGGHKGVMRYIDDIVGHIENWSRSRGCDMIALEGRKGWKKVADRLGGESRPLLSAWRAL